MSLPIETDKWGNAVLQRGRDYSAWEVALEHAESEGLSIWKQIRERHGLTPQDLESLTQGEIMWEEVHMTEDRPGMPSLTYLKWMALLEGIPIGALLDLVLLDTARELDG